MPLALTSDRLARSSRGSCQAKALPARAALFRLSRAGWVRDIQAQLPRTLCSGLTYGPIRKITDAVLDAVVV